MSPSPEKKRCSWPGNPLAIDYHDREWGVPVRDDRVLFEFLILEGAQAGLSWDTVLKKREHYRKVFGGFDPTKVARYGEKEKASLMEDAGIIRNRAKIEASVTNAKAFLAVQQEYGSFSKYVWGFVGGKPVQGRRKTSGDIPTRTEVSDALSTDLKKRGFKFVGTTIMYAFMQATGMANDHLAQCFRHREPSK
ncbi:MAG: DNA-3-methyladenine glycosylase I [Betaproteobacteria bacterium]|nr:DNA-3-methyladenine glycosylase I [Betaproteobacteria bacterium]